MMMTAKKTFFQQKRIFKGKLLELFTRKAILKNGYLVELETINHPGAALVVPFLSEEKIVFLRQFRPVIGKFIYELPAGTIDGKESMTACARREIQEETGYSAKKITRLGEIYPVPGYSNEKIVIFRAEGLRKTKVSPEKDEIIRKMVFNRKKVRELFSQGKIIDAKTISALAYCGWL